MQENYWRILNSGIADGELCESSVLKNAQETIFCDLFCSYVHTLSTSAAETR